MLIFGREKIMKIFYAINYFGDHDKFSCVSRKMRGNGCAVFKRFYHHLPWEKARFVSFSKSKNKNAMSCV